MGEVERRLRKGTKGLPQSGLLITILVLFFGAMVGYQNGFVYFDEGIYVASARAITTGGEQGYFEHFRPPLLPLLLSPFLMIPADPLLVARGCMFALSIICVFAMFWVGRRHFGTAAGLWAAFLFATSGLVLSFAGRVLVNLPAATLATLALSLMLERKQLLAGVAVGACLLMRFTGSIAVAFIGVVLLVQSLHEQTRQGFGRKLGQSIGRYAGGIALVLIPFLTINCFINEGPLLTRMLRPFLDGLFAVGATSPFYAESSVGGYALVLLSEALAVICAITAMAHNKHRKEKIAFLALGLLFLCFYAFGVRHFEERFAIEALVPLLVVGGAGAAELIARTGRLHRQAALLLIVACLLIAVLRIPHEVVHDPAIAQEIRTHEGTVITNTGVAALYAQKTQLITGKNPGPLLLEHGRANGTLLVIDADALFHCGEFDCREERDRTLARMQATFGMHEGYLHGRKTLLYGQERGRVSAPDVIVRLRMVGFVDGSLDRERELGEFLDEIGGRVFLILNASCNAADAPTCNAATQTLGRETRALLGRREVTLGVEEAPGASSEAFLSMLSPQGLPVTVASAYEDSWPHDMVFPSTITRCFSGAWDEHATSVPCERVDLYVVDGWSARRLKTDDELAREFAVRALFDDHVVVDVPWQYVPASETARIARFLSNVS